jgi:hypothetical protein
MKTIVEFRNVEDRLYKIYQEFVQTVNSELSKGILLQTGTTDEKSFSGSLCSRKFIKIFD